MFPCHTTHTNFCLASPTSSPRTRQHIIQGNKLLRDHPYLTISSYISRPTSPRNIIPRLPLHFVISTSGTSLRACVITTSSEGSSSVPCQSSKSSLQDHRLPWRRNHTSRTMTYIRHPISTIRKHHEYRTDFQRRPKCRHVPKSNNSCDGTSEAT